MNKHAMPEPLKAGLWYARTPGLPHFTLGPWPSPEDALEELEAGEGAFSRRKLTDLVELGKLEPWTIETPVWDHVQGMLDKLESEARESGGPGADWAARLADIRKGDAELELNRALRLVVHGWMATHECFPHFGFVLQVRRYRFDGGAWRPEAEPGQPPPAAPRTQFCRNTLHGVPCIWSNTATYPGHTCHFPCPTYQDGQRCRMEVGHNGPHWFACGKDLGCGDICDREQGHPGECKCEVPF